MRYSLAVALALTSTVQAASTPPPMRIVVAGDSTAQDYKADRYPQSGWGTMLRCAVADNVTIDNRAIGGRSTNSFIREGRLDKIAADLKKGDTLLIQFGHNDASIDKPERYTTIPQYEANLRRFLDVAKKAGAKPVIITPVARRDFRDGVEQPSFPTYADAARRVARATHTPLIDLGASSQALVQAAGPDSAKAYYLHLDASANAPGFPKGVADDTHFSELGARRIADLVAIGLKDTRLPVAKYVRVRTPALTRATPAGGPTCG
ncbi:lysophospholipase L1-like esterase [Sphingomonas jinjuensis]|uniref:Lysophospholipase L1-like esterase n=1 Tax=Sphingomonas jinjuensis TaxID=535907 RepID=A0A840F509_9SPHN|nr:rhamnogalacturonan acetylesterase [Sphingomonas jinjuensis]MBB4154383.1 lysophospholipase L1-like esterase [Sphingomonas jinjuensis]